ncbi:MAG: 2-oxoglutarate dehydrogenase E1 component [Bacteroidetes bacterium]|nr:2-oxoglutarate dehydrogenase E1 component [Bacteroidota bacterium]
MDQHSYIGNSSPEALEAMYLQFLDNPSSVEESWRQFFSGFEFAKHRYGDDAGASGAPVEVNKEFKVINLINGYRSRGHLFTKTNPVRERRKYTPDLSLETFGLSNADLDSTFQAGQEIGIGTAKLKDIVAMLEQTYCQSVGAEYKYIRTPEVIEWMEKKMESCRNGYNFSISEKKRILEKLNDAVAFENFIHTKFTGQKRFSLEGAESLIPALDAVIDTGAELGIKEFVIGMAHRGRLNVLANILGKSYEDIFSEFEGKEFDENAFDGDVKYHLGFSSDVTTPHNKKVHLGLTPNPSHLEAVDPIVQGIVRAKIDNTPGGDFNQIAPILIHGDAAVAAQGIVYEVIQMSLLKGYGTGGTIHLVINNQVGFTTNYIDARSSTYCTDVGKVTLSPVFHVNGDDVEALVYTIRFAMEYRQKFHRDVFIDILCYRKYGHNEGDEPRFTQPLLYKAISTHANPREIYNQKLLSQGIVEANLAKEMEKKFKELLQRSLDLSKLQTKTKVKSFMEGNWSGLRLAVPEDFEQSPTTGVEKKTLLQLAAQLCALPGDKTFFSKIVRLFEDRKQMLTEPGRLDWAMGELLAYATLLNEGYPVRVSGQDVERGTFSHRHAVVRVEDSEEQYVPLNHLTKNQAPFYIYNSLLSEYGVLGFDYGYCFSAPNTLVIWEAQFGDFGNGAQIIIDQYISSAEDKWRRMNGIVLLLPHGYEGQGAEHSSGRMERFLSLSAENNMQIVNCTTPANFFHLLRRQLKREFRKPLVVFTPKSLLRHPKCVSEIDDFTKGGFNEVIDDNNVQPENVQRVVFCSGKIYYDLLEKQLQEKSKEVAIVRIEQLYPFPYTKVRELTRKYKQATDFCWAQEEPENMGAWSYLLRVFRDLQLKYIGRPESASPATGSHKQHEKEQQAIINKVFTLSAVQQPVTNP